MMLSRTRAVRQEGYKHNAHTMYRTCTVCITVWSVCVTRISHARADRQASSAKKQTTIPSKKYHSAPPLVSVLLGIRFLRRGVFRWPPSVRFTPPPLTTESPTTHTTDQHHVPIDPRAAELMPIHAARLALTRSVTQEAVDPSIWGPRSASALRHARRPRALTRGRPGVPGRPGTGRSRRFTPSLYYNLPRSHVRSDCHLRARLPPSSACGRRRHLR